MRPGAQLELCNSRTHSLTQHDSYGLPRVCRALCEAPGIQGADSVNLVQLVETDGPSKHYQVPAARPESCNGDTPQARAVRVEVPHSCPARAQHSALRWPGCGKQVNTSSKVHT